MLKGAEIIGENGEIEHSVIEDSIGRLREINNPIEKALVIRGLMTALDRELGSIEEQFPDPLSN